MCPYFRANSKQLSGFLLHVSSSSKEVVNTFIGNALLKL